MQCVLDVFQNNVHNTIVSFHSQTLFIKYNHAHKMNLIILPITHQIHKTVVYTHEKEICK